MTERPSRDSHPSLLSNRPLLRRVASAVRPFRGRVAGLAVVMTAAAAFPLMQPLLLRTVVDGLAAGHGFSSFVGVLVLIGLFGVLAVVMDFIGARVAGNLGHRIVEDLQGRLFDHLVRLPLPFYATVRPGTVASRLTNDVYATEPLFTTVLVNAFAHTVGLVGAVAVLAVVDIRLTLVLLLVPLVMIPVRKAESRINAVLGASFRQNAELTSRAETTLTRDGVLLARQSGRLAHETAGFNALATDVRATSVRLASWRAAVGAGYGGVFAVAYIVLLVGGAWLVADGRMTIGTLVLFLLYLRQIQGPVTSLVGLRYPAMRAGAAFTRVFDVLDSRLRPEVTPGGPEAPEGTDAASLVFEGVTYTHPAVDDISIPGLSHRGAVFGPGALGLTAVEHGQQIETVRESGGTAVRSVEIEVGPGETVAVVGPSGAGKSTLALLAAGLLTPTEGRVLVKGADTRRSTPEQLSRAVALISQETYVLHATVAENIRYVRPEATEEEVRAACRAASLDVFVDSLPDGYETMVGEKGYRLSGGERQRLAIARALLKRASVVILDEPTSQLDAETELRLLASFEELFATSAVLVVAHRLSTVRHADRILVMEQGRIVESGPHHRLLGLPGGRYAALHQAQTAGSRPVRGNDRTDPARGGDRVDQI
ncbi:ABC transporter ATP-binding protein [Streptomyces anulatus]|uniref:ABC transporter ATP-binding protein n=1 Tax=Streptomyces anulatus TaxID=1892 RepID=UPI0036FEED9A